MKPAIRLHTDHTRPASRSCNAPFTPVLWVLTLVATAAVATAQPLPSLDEPWPSGTRRFTLAQASGTTGASSAAPPEADNPAELAKQLQNPVADLISVPLQHNWDFGIGPAEAMRYTVNIQPVMPWSLTTDWHLILRTILPVIYAESPVPGGDNRAGLGEMLQSFFSRPQRQRAGAGSGGLARYASIRVPPRTRWARSNLPWGPRPWCSHSRAAGRMACWPITAGRWLGRATVPR